MLAAPYFQMTSSEDDQQFLCLEASPEEMDRFWAEGWRHFGIFFFRYRSAVHGNKLFSVLPLRLDIPRFVQTRSLKRVLAANRDIATSIRPSSVNKAKQALFLKHAGSSLQPTGMQEGGRPSAPLIGGRFDARRMLAAPLLFVVAAALVSCVAPSADSSSSRAAVLPAGTAVAADAMDAR